jgi:hypothetical protein
MPSLKDFHEVQKVNIIQYGEAGTGKSIRAASAHVWGPVFFFDFDGKISTVFEFYKDDPETLSRIHYETFTDAPSAFAKLVALQKDPGEIKTIVWDSWTAWEQFYLRQVMLENPGFKRMRVNIAGGTVTVPDQADYRIHAHCQWEFISLLTATPTNVIVNCHVQVKMDELTGIDRGLQAAGKLSKVLPKYFMEVHRTFVRENEYAVQVKSDSDFTCNTRLRNVPTNGVVGADLSLFSTMALRASPEKERK